jgi:hypothetical protein
MNRTDLVSPTPPDEEEEEDCWTSSAVFLACTERKDVILACGLTFFCFEDALSFLLPVLRLRLPLENILKRWWRLDG